MTQVTKSRKPLLFPGLKPQCEDYCIVKSFECIHTSLLDNI